jgi:hypothetical protein
MGDRTGAKTAILLHGLTRYFLWMRSIRRNFQKIGENEISALLVWVIAGLKI